MRPPSRTAAMIGSGMLGSVYTPRRTRTSRPDLTADVMSWVDIPELMSTSRGMIERVRSSARRARGFLLS